MKNKKGLCAMTKTYKLKNLDCANCAAKIENALNKLSDMQEVSVSFMTQKLSFTTQQEPSNELLEQIRKTIQKIEPDCTIVI